MSAISPAPVRLFLNLRDSVDKKVVEATAGSFGYDQVFTMGSTKAGDGSLLYAAEANTYNGPWTVPDDMQKFSGLLRYSQGTATDGSASGDGLFERLEHYRTKTRCGRSRPGKSVFTARSTQRMAVTPSRYSLSARDGAVRC